VPCRDRNGQDSAGCVDPSVERELADHERVVDRAAFQFAGRRQQAERDRQVEGGARLAHVGRGEIDRDAVRRKLVSRVPDRGFHSMVALANGRIGKADHREAREAKRDVHLDVHGKCLDSKERRRAQACEHARGLVQG
jgi:hypothetical protein